MTSFLDLPRELRQSILQLALKDAIDHDTRLNELLRDGLLFQCQQQSIWISTKDYFDVFFESVPIKKSYAPSIAALAATLLMALPDLAEEILFVLDVELDGFVDAEQEIQEEKAIIHLGLSVVTLGRQFAFEYRGTTLKSHRRILEMGLERMDIAL